MNASIVALAQKAAPSEQSKADKHKKKEPPGFSGVSFWKKHGGKRKIRRFLTKSEKM